MEEAIRWDAGLLGIGTDSRRETINEAFFNRLNEWRPRRPTVLLLDEPHDAEALSTVEKLDALRDEFYFPVRLIICSQIIPATLRDKETGHLLYGGILMKLTPAEYLTETEVARLAFGTMPLREEHILNLQRFMRESSGKPLLVELGLRDFRLLKVRTAEQLSPGSCEADR